MGSFASSIHVRSNDTAAVLAALDACLRAEGYVRQTDVPARPTPPARGVYVAHAVEGWVGVLDSDSGESGGLAGNVAGALDTRAQTLPANTARVHPSPIMLAAPFGNRDDGMPCASRHVDEGPPAGCSRSADGKGDGTGRATRRHGTATIRQQPRRVRLPVDALVPCQP